MLTPETSEKRAIKQLLHLRGYFCYPNLQSLGSFLGVPDITAISPKGVVVQIECKAKSLKTGVMNKQSDHQRDFQREWESNGGVYILGDMSEVAKRLGIVLI